MSDVIDFVIVAAFVAMFSFLGYTIGDAKRHNEKVAGAEYLSTRMPPCIEQGYTEKHCFGLAMKELEELSSLSSSQSKAE